MSIPNQPLTHTQLLVHVGHIAHNLHYFRSFLKPTTKLMALVKANAYGHGATGLSLVLERLRLADSLGVAFPCEGIELRKAGVSLPITVLTPGYGTFGDLIAHDLQPEIHTFEALLAYAQAAKDKGRARLPFHLAIDSGMHRVGFESAQIPELIQYLKNNPYLSPASVFSHLAAADEARHDAFTQGQIDLFDQISGQICDALPHPVMRHILNSAGTERFAHAQFDMVRIGIGMYGTSAVDAALLRHPSSLQCPVIQIKDIPFGDTVGYGRHGKTPDGPKRIATLPIGYADGIDRRLSRGTGHFMVNGVLAPTIGNICMDMCMIDISHIDAKAGDTVTLFGGPPALTAIDWAQTLGTISYEIYTSIGQRVQRVYI
ncbi:MAG: alanine racemase [Bacteroidales bacterium]|nr:alanine racemase [Bacteroidales bacterium]MCL2738691.1 alanine racemase [Bacteroidales bacterium]